MVTLFKIPFPKQNIFQKPVENKVIPEVRTHSMKQCFIVHKYVINFTLKYLYLIKQTYSLQDLFMFKRITNLYYTLQSRQNESTINFECYEKHLKRPLFCCCPSLTFLRILCVKLPVCTIDRFVLIIYHAI